MEGQVEVIGVPLFSTLPDGQVVISWPEGRAENVRMPSEALEAFIDDRNAMIVEIARLKAALGE